MLFSQLSLLRLLWLLILLLLRTLPTVTDGAWREALEVLSFCVPSSAVGTGEGTIAKEDSALKVLMC